MAKCRLLQMLQEKQAWNSEGRRKDEMRHVIIDASQLELEDNVVSIKRVSKTVKGGRTSRFTALVIVGDRNGHVGAGLGKAVEIPEAIRKGREDAMKHLISVARDENNSITHDYIGKYGSAEVLLKRAPEGTGIIAGGTARAVVELAGIQNIRTKCLGSNNKQNVVLATIEGLKALKTPEEVARRRGKSVDEILA
jgi:small subunit ribosomal protein S5